MHDSAPQSGAGHDSGHLDGTPKSPVLQSSASVATMPSRRHVPPGSPAHAASNVPKAGDGLPALGARNGGDGGGDAGRTGEARGTEESVASSSTVGMSSVVTRTHSHLVRPTPSLIQLARLCCY